MIQSINQFVKFFFQISKSRTTIVITTHYIEEARQANVVGMMRFGKLLAENSPHRLLITFQLPSLEEVFLQLCQRDESERGGEDAHIETQVKTSITIHKYCCRIWVS